MSKTKNIKKDSNKYNAENEIIIGVTTKPKKDINKKSNNANKSKKREKKIVDIKKEKIIKKKNKKIKVIGIIVLLLILICAGIYYLTTPQFNISNIIIIGNEKNSEDTYISLSKIKLGETNIFAITNNMIQKRLKENSYVESVNINRKFPNTIEINVEERKVKYQIEYNDKFIYIDKQGYILEINDTDANVIKLVGLIKSNENMENIKRLDNDKLAQLEIITKIINYCDNNNITEEITQIDVSNTTNYTIYFEQERKTVYLGDASNLNERILWLKTILQKEKGNEGKIFINGDLNKDKVYFKESK